MVEYNKLLNEQLSLGIIEPAPKTTQFLTHYLPHRALLQKNKIRVVYDASAKTKSGFSLNDLLYKGPVLLEDLVGLLLNFRLHSVALTSDIEKAFLQVGLNEVDRDAVRFIWVKDPKAPITPNNLIIYRFARVPFGVISSPFLLNVVLQELLTTEPVNDWHTVAKSKFYVDNLVLSVKNTTDAINVHHSVTSKLKSASFNLRDWTSNDAQFLKSIGHPPLDNSSARISILGINWQRQTDTFHIKLQPIALDNLHITKRIVLKFSASIFDPLGFFSPCVLPVKVFLQECWKNKYSWDDPLPSDLLARWLKIYKECVGLTDIPIPRRYWTYVEDAPVTLHIFCDASKTAYACCAYLSYANTDNCHFQSSLIYSKVRVAPVSKTSNDLTIPKLELLGALIGSRASIFLKNHLDIKVVQTIVWTDATTVLQWLSTGKLLSKFIQNRIVEIRKTPDTIFRYVPTDCNPADIASRGIRADLIKSNDLWWHGPSWLNHEDLWPPTPDTTQSFHSHAAVLAVSESKYVGPLSDDLEHRFSSWNAYIRVFKYINRFKFSHLSANKPSSLEEFQCAETGFLLEIQRKYFRNEFSMLRSGQQPNPQLKLVIDEKGLLRCEGRMQNAAFPWDTIHPILLPRESPLTEIYIRKLHTENFHLGCTHLLAKIRERFWITKCRSKVKSIIHRCTICRRWEGGSYALPPLPPLPLMRVAEASPFLHTGIDYAGFVTIASESKDPVKAYIVLFVCLVTRAIHLEIARDLSADEFLLVFTKFSAIRGSPKIVISDNATNFTFVQPLVGRKVKFTDPKVDLKLNDNNIQWKFIPQYAPWHGGAYERLVSTVKRGLKKAYGTSFLDYAQFSAVLYRLADTINSRPLTYVSSEELLSPLTPNHFLRLRTVNVLEQVEVTARPLPSTTTNLIKSWELTTNVVDAFWEAFRSLYLLSLRETHSSIHNPVKGSVAFIPKPGDIVLVQEPSAPRATWKFGVIECVSKRSSLATIKCDGKSCTRSINQLFPLELPTSATHMDTSIPNKKPRSS